jgi:ABC-type amino acid transport substrate-binding protein
MLFGCGKSSVEDVAKDYVKKQFAFDNNVKIDTSKLKYTVTKKEGNKATVSVSGSINFDGQLYLVKQGKKWKISKKENLYETPKKVASNTELKKEVPHTEQTTLHKQTSHN